MADKKVAVLDAGRIKPIETGDTPVDGDGAPIGSGGGVDLKQVWLYT